MVRSPRGFGETVFVAFDLETSPFTTWAARPQLLARLLGKTVARAAGDESQSLGQVTTLGFEDLSGQLRGALDQFAGVGHPVGSVDLLAEEELHSVPSCSVDQPFMRARMPLVLVPHFADVSPVGQNRMQLAPSELRQ